MDALVPFLMRKSLTHSFDDRNAAQAQHSYYLSADIICFPNYTIVDESQKEWKG